MTRLNILICIAAAVIFVSFWGLLNRPEMEPPWPTIIQGFAFSPMRPWNDPLKNNFPSESEIDADLKLLAGKTNAVRTYSVEGVLARIPELAQKHGLNVALGAWLDKDLQKNEEQIETLIKLARENYRNVVRVIIGNEAILRKDLTIAQLNGYLARVRKELDIPVSTAEPWHVWIEHPELGDHVDFLAIHMLPYWEGVHLDQALDHVIEKYSLVSSTYPDKPIVITEVGWPSNGRTRQDAVASQSNEATFLRRFLNHAENQGYVYYILEAFDQPWKRKNSEGAVGAYWGVYDADRQPKFPFVQPIVSIPEWHLLAAISVTIAAVAFMLLLIDSRNMRFRGSGFLASVTFIAASGAVWIVYSYTRQYLTLPSLLVGILLFLGLAGFAVVLLAEAHEWAEALWGSTGSRPLSSVDTDDKELPKVSIHVPAYNEPAEMMIETLNALARLNYPDYEVIVMDNNTKDPATWKPVEEHCRFLGERFRFYHEDQLAGFKAGALNYCLAVTSRDADVVAVIDSDYVVDPNWLLDLAPQFLRPEIAIVQAPQDYRDDRDNLFKAMCYSEYSGFFNIGMVIRNERNAIIQHGTMTMVRKSVLEEVGKWAEWCITEDAELGLRIFERGHQALYVPKSYGRGVMPDTFIDFKKQRYRWAYGAVQILKYHRRSLLGINRSRLSYGQRYHFVAGWLPWIADSINLIFTLAALAWSIAMIHLPYHAEPPLIILTIVPLSFFVFKVTKMFYLYQYRVSTSATRTIASAVAGLALTHTIAKAILLGFFTRSLPFFRTPKKFTGGTFRYALRSAREEGLMAVALLLAAFILVKQQGLESTDMLVWILVLLVQSTPYLAAIVMSFISAFKTLPAAVITQTSTPPHTVSTPVTPLEPGQVSEKNG
jgi:exo-beta-1,3-glucanase (GH17 family)/cellulose synthase/poly-beta-1,6-N-acetylglucosamine synthase-like glycosyltransferase